MADKKISALTSATTPLAGTEVLPIVQSGATVKVATNDLTVQNIRANATSGILQITGPAAASTRVATVPDANWSAARIDAAQSFIGNQTLSTGNLVQGTAAKGFDFTANTPAAGMSSQLLNSYEEGAWTPSIGGTATYTTQEGYYVKVGELVYLQCKIQINVIGTGSTTTISGMPFASFASSFSSGGSGGVTYFGSLATLVTTLTPWVGGSSSTIKFAGLTAAGNTMTSTVVVFGSGTRIDFSMTYRSAT
jgi:hypothetical protein